MKTVLLALVIGLCAGWFARGWYQDSLQLTIEKTTKVASEQFRDDLVAVSADSAWQLEQKLEGLKNATPVEIRTEIVKPVFTNVCVTDDFVRMYNNAASAAERALSGKPADPLPGKSATTAGDNGS